MPVYPRGTPSLDLLRLPLVGRFLRWRRARLALQLPMAVLGAVMIAHAFLGPQLAPKNLATLLTWVHFRGLVVLVILLAGNLFCMACPFLLPRELARRWITPRYQWPRWLRNKWPSIVLMVLVLFVYELFDLWASPWWTGVLIVAYFALATAVDGLFRRAAFCKYVCPIGQVNFLGATLSPLEVSIRDRDVCLDCRTKDCIRGTAGRAAMAEQTVAQEKGVAGERTEANDPMRLPVIVQRGCELALFQPRKVDNLDCTFCLDCVYACPHDNIGILSRLPADRLAASGPRSGLGRLEKRFDFTALVTVFTFGALLNAFAMVSPVYAFEQWIAGVTGLRVEWPILAGLFSAGLVLEPAALLGLAAWITRLATDSSENLLSIVNRFARSLIPIGFGVWLAHYGLHFFTGFLTIIPVVQNAVQEATGRRVLGDPLWQLGGLPDSIVAPIEIGFLVLGLVGSCLVTWTIASQSSQRRAWHAFWPWASVHAILFLAAVWIMHQPMEMRGTFLGP